MGELKPCPFCGGEAEIEVNHTDYTNGEHTTTYEPKCNDCLLSRQPLQCKKTAINAWNQRQDGWISVEDGYPKEAGHYLCYAIVGSMSPKTRVMERRLSQSDIDRKSTNLGDWVRLTHWKPLPGAPKQ